jgi:hypothetical protein
MNTVRGKWLIGGALAALLIFGCIGTVTAGAFMMGSRFNGPMMYNRQGPAQVAPGDDLPQQPAPRGYRDDRFRNYGPGMLQPGYGRGFNPFGFIGGIFRLLFTLALLALIVLVLRRLFFGRGPRWGWGWGGPGSHSHAPPWAEEMHRKMHERMDAAPVAATPAAAEAPPAPVTDAPVNRVPAAPGDEPAASQRPTDAANDAPSGEQRSV